MHVTAGYLKLLIELLRPADSQVDRNWMIGLQPSGMWTRQTEIHSRPVQSRRLLLRLRHPALQPPVAPRRPLVVNRRAPTKTARPAQPNSTKRLVVAATPALQFQKGRRTRSDVRGMQPRAEWMFLIVSGGGVFTRCRVDTFPFS